MERGAHGAQPPGGRPRGLLSLAALVVATTLGLGVSTVATIARVVLSPLLRRLLGTRLLASEDQDAATAAPAFVRSFQRLYGERCPRFLACTYREALQQAQRESKFLLLYLHSAEHQDTHAFCSRTLCDETVLEFLQANVLVWGGDIRSSEAYQVSGMLRNSTFPHLALVLLSGAGAKPSLVASFPGAKSAQAFLNVLAQAIEDHGAALVAARADAEERDYNRLIRAEQDAEYEASLAADHARSEAAAAEREMAAREAAESAALVAAQLAASAAAAQAAAERAASMMARQAAKAAALAEEPPARPGTVQILLRFPDGKRLQRRFDGDRATTADVYDWAEAEGVQGSFKLVTSLPRVVYERGKQTLHAAGLSAQAALLLELTD